MRRLQKEANLRDVKIFMHLHLKHPPHLARVAIPSLDHASLMKMERKVVAK